MTWTAPPRRTGTPEVLVIDRRVDADRALLLPRGWLVHGCTAVLADALAALPAGLARLDLDMGAVEFMDPAGLRFLDLLGGYSHRKSVPATTANWRGQPVRVLESSGLDTTDPLRTTTRARGPGPAPDTAAAPDRAPGAERADRMRTLEQEVGQLRHALASRPVIDQARGVLMALHSCTSNEAWHILREASQLSNTKLRTVAAAVVAGAGNGGPPPPPEVRAALRTALGRLGR
ncbi:ANTAR domain-containing protein [Streptomyces sp. enrichment culture]|uniref:ANTAR domain-containing protein n=1 Tax=Streptomyces sp. enrichment culture TaxID=1795815 RepID=UPI003F5709DC